MRKGILEISEGEPAREKVKCKDPEVTMSSLNIKVNSQLLGVSGECEQGRGKLEMCLDK